MGLFTNKDKKNSSSEESSNEEKKNSDEEQISSDVTEAVEENESSTGKKNSKANPKDVFFALPGTPPKNGSTAIVVDVKEGSKIVGRKEVQFKITKGAVRVSGDLESKKRLQILKILSEAGFIQVKEGDEIFKKNVTEASQLVHEYTLVHPDADKGDEDTAEYELKYNDAGEPVTVTLLVKRGIVKTSNKLWCDHLVGLGFRLDKDHVIK